MINLYNQDCLPAMREMKDKQYQLSIVDPPYAATLLGWIMLIRGPCDFRFIGAAPPCNKGEIDISLHWFHIVIGWQKGREVEG